MTAITDEQMQQMLTNTKAYSIVLLKPGPEVSETGIEKIIWEHGRRNLALRADGLMPIVCPVTIEHGISGICILNASPEESARIMDGDPAVQAGIFEYEVLPCRSFPGDSLPV